MSSQRSENQRDRPRINAAVARLDTKPHKTTKRQRLRDHRRAQAWQRKGGKR